MSVEIVTFGCRLNAFESEVIRHEAESAGLSDTIVINSCAVTNEAVAQARQSIRRLKRERPERRIVVTGCAAQTQPDMFAGMGQVQDTHFAACARTYAPANFIDRFHRGRSRLARRDRG